MANQLLLKFKNLLPKVASSLFMTILLINGHALAENSVIDADVVIENQHQSNTVLGQNLFNGSFANQSFSGFNPNYRIAVGDKLLVQMWGAVESNGQQEVDTQGNIFLPQVGPINVLGILNSDLNKKGIHRYQPHL